MTCIPRTIAPLVTTTTASPAARRSATTSQMCSRTSARSAPASSAVMLEPSLMTTRAMCRASLRQLEHAAGDLDGVAGLEAERLELADDAHPVQLFFDVRERLLVLEVVAGEE